MWDESPPPVDEQNAEEFSQPEVEAELDPASNANWTDGQLMRLENEFRKAQRSFAYHPVIGIRPLRGDPPHEYQIDYRVRTLATNDAGELEYVDEVSMHLWLPPGFPNQPPVVRPMSAVFHPNVAWEGIYLTRPWQPTDTLVTFAGRIGELLTYRSYDPESVVNAVAMDWLEQNSGSLPLDNRSDFSPFNGGEPLGRIQKLGPGTLDQIRRALDDMRFALVAEEGVPTADEVTDFAKQTRSALSLFLDGDVPDNLRQQASEFDDWCRELPDSVPAWDYLRAQRTRAAAAETAAVNLKNAARLFKSALDELERLVPDISSTMSASMAIKHVPSMEVLAPLQLKLPPLAREFEKYNLEARKVVAAMKAPLPHVSVAPEGSLGRRLAQQAQGVKVTVEAASKTADSAMAEVAALYRRARPEIQALEQIVGWREYMNMFVKARELEKQMQEWGSAGVQAFFLENASGTFGPFQFEEPLDLGEDRVVVRSVQRGQIEVSFAAGQEILGRGTDGSVSIVVGKSAGQAGHTTTFRATERCDDLIVQISFIHEQTVEALGRLKRPVPGATSWCGIIAALMADPQQQENLRDGHRKATQRWKAVITDLAALARFKERLATYHLITRMSEEVPRLQALLVKTQARHNEATTKIAGIMSKSSRDMETDRLIVPPKLAKNYSDEMNARDQAKHDFARTQTLLKQIARELAARLSASRSVGRPEIPEARAIPPLPDELMALADAMGDEPMKQAVAALGTRLGVELTFKAPPAPVITQVDRPAAPARPPRLAQSPTAEATIAPVEIPETSEAAETENFAGEEPVPAEATEGESVGEQEATEYADPVSTMEFGTSEEEPASEDEMIEGFFTDHTPPGHDPHSDTAKT